MTSTGKLKIKFFLADKSWCNTEWSIADKQSGTGCQKPLKKILIRRVRELFPAPWY
jgi:hypothetical protein